jgi:hypothetical protein
VAEISHAPQFNHRLIGADNRLTRGFTNVKFAIYLVNGITKIALSACSSLGAELLKCAGNHDFNQGLYGQQVNTLLLYRHVFEIGITN